MEDAGGELLETMRTLMADETFAAVLTASEELTAQIMAWAESMDAQPLYTRVYPYPELDAALSYVNEGEALPLSDPSLPDEALLKAACRGRGWLLSGGRFDLERGAALVLDEFRAGKVGKISLESPEV